MSNTTPSNQPLAQLPPEAADAALRLGAPTEVFEPGRVGVVMAAILGAVSLFATLPLLMVGQQQELNSGAVWLAWLIILPLIFWGLRLARTRVWVCPKGVIFVKSGFFRVASKTVHGLAWDQIAGVEEQRNNSVTGRATGWVLRGQDGSKSRISIATIRNADRLAELVRAATQPLGVPWEVRVMKGD